MKKFIIVVIIIIVVILLCTKLPKKDVNTNTVNNVVNEVTSVENTIENEENNESDKNSVQNTAANEVNSNKVEENVVISSKDIYDKDPDAATAAKKDEAIALVKKKWGEDNTVTFRVDSIADNGEYVIAVVSNQTKTVKNYFRVNLESKSVEVDY